MLKTFLPKAFRSEKTPSNKGYFNLESWIQNRINDGTIALENIGGDNLYTADGEITEQRTVTITDTALSFTDGSDSFLNIENDGGLVLSVYDAQPISWFEVNVPTKTIKLGNDHGGFDNATTRSYVMVQEDSLILGVYDGDTIDSYIQVTNTGDIAIGIDGSGGAGTFSLSAPIHLMTVNDATRDALSVSNGALVYNSEYDEIQAYVNNTWVKISTEAVSTP